MPLPRKLLLILVRHPNQTLSPGEISASLWPNSGEVKQTKRYHDNLPLVVHRLRQVFASGPLGREVIRGVYGKGYRLEASVESFSGLKACSDRCQPDQPGSPPRLPSSAEDPARTEDPRLLSSLFYAEAHDLWPDNDPYSLPRQQWLIQQSIDYDPTFGQGYLELCYLQLLQCLWGVRSSASTLPGLQRWLHMGDALPTQAPGWAAIKAEAMSLLFWQPQTSDRLYGNWLASTLPPGLPRLSWARHLIFTGRAGLALDCLQSQAHQNLRQGWLLTSLAHAALGEIPMAQEAALHQLRLNPALVGSQLFLAMLAALRGESEAATAWIEACGILEKPFQGSLALVAYALAQGRLRSRAQHLLDEAMTLIPASPDRVGAPGYWGLAALALDRSADAIVLLKLSVRQRCYSAPVLLATPFLAPYAHTPAGHLFRSRMGRAFVSAP